MDNSWADPIVPFFVTYHNQDIDGALFRIGQVVQAITNGQVIFGAVLGVAKHDATVFEYAIEGYPLLLWEKELTAVLPMDTKEQVMAHVDRLEFKMDHYLYWVLRVLNVCQPDNYKWTGERDGRTFTFYSPDKKRPVIVRAMLPWGNAYDMYLDRGHDGIHIGYFKLPGCGDAVRRRLDELWREQQII